MSPSWVAAAASSLTTAASAPLTSALVSSALATLSCPDAPWAGGTAVPQASSQGAPAPTRCLSAPGSASPHAPPLPSPSIVPSPQPQSSSADPTSIGAAAPAAWPGGGSAARAAGAASAAVGLSHRVSPVYSQ